MKKCSWCDDSCLCLCHQGAYPCNIRTPNLKMNLQVMGEWIRGKNIAHVLIKLGIPFKEHNAWRTKVRSALRESGWEVSNGLYRKR